MARNTKLSTAISKAMLFQAAYGAFVPSGIFTVGQTYMYLMTGVQPSTPETPLTDQIILVQIPLFNNYSYPTTNVQSFGVSSGIAVASGIATWFILAGPPYLGLVPSFTGSVGLSGCDVNLSTVNINSGDQVMFQTPPFSDVGGTLTIL